MIRDQAVPGLDPWQKYVNFVHRMNRIRLLWGQAFALAARMPVYQEE
jgi:hypothetical protein